MSRRRAEVGEDSGFIFYSLHCVVNSLEGSDARPVLIRRLRLSVHLGSSGSWTLCLAQLVSFFDINIQIPLTAFQGQHSWRRELYPRIASVSELRQDSLEVSEEERIYSKRRVGGWERAAQSRRRCRATSME